MLRRSWWILGLVLVGGGLALALSSHSRPADFGWFAYSPLSSSHVDRHPGPGDLVELRGSSMIVSRWQLLGCALAALGLVVVAAGIGHRLGRRRHLPASGDVAVGAGADESGGRVSP